MRRCGSGRAAWLAQNLRGAEGRCDSARVFCEAGEDARARQASGFPAEVRVNGVHGSGPLSLEWAHQEGEFVGFLQLVQLLVTIAIGSEDFFFSLVYQYLLH